MESKRGISSGSTIEGQLKACKLICILQDKDRKPARLVGKGDPGKYDFLGFCIRPVIREVNGRKLTLPGTFVSNSSKKEIREKFREMEIHKQRARSKR
jgi:hypothetical protein